MLLRSHRMLCVRSTLGIHTCIPSEYDGIRRLIIFYEEAKCDLGMFKIIYRMPAYSIYVTHTLTIRKTYAGYVRHIIDMKE